MKNANASDKATIYYGRLPTIVGELLSADLCSLSSWIRDSKMQFNIKKSSVMWFSTKSCSNVVQPQVFIDETPFSQVDKQKYLGVTFDSRLTWSSHVAAVCKSMAYYLYLINYHSKSLPLEILKMLVESLVFSRLTYALPVWGPTIDQNSLSRINRLHNRAVCITRGLHKSEHVSSHRQTIGWLSASSLIQQRTLCATLDQYTSRSILLNPHIQYGCYHTPDTKYPLHFATIALALSKHHFCHQATSYMMELLAK